MPRSRPPRPSRWPLAAFLVASALTVTSGSVLAVELTRAQAAAPTTLATSHGTTTTQASPTPEYTTAATVGTDQLSSAQRTIVAKLKRRIKASALGDTVVGQVVDLDSGTVVWSRRGATAVMPASTTKITTAVTVYETLGAKARISTTVVRDGDEKRVYLVGGADPSLTVKHLRALAEQTATALLEDDVTRVQLRLDDSLLPAPTRAKGWKRSYLTSAVAPVRALGLHGRIRSDTTADAGAAFADALEAEGVTVTRTARGTAPATAVELAEHRSATMATLVERMLLDSDNEYAEKLLRLAAIQAGHEGSWRGARTTRTEVLDDLGITEGYTLYDGSGLSRSDRVTGPMLTSLLDVITQSDTLSPIVDSLPVSGRSGTLSAALGRFSTSPTRCAKGLISAKTGTLDDVAALAGYAEGPDGEVLAFTFIENGAWPGGAHPQLDRLATTLTGCW